MSKKKTTSGIHQNSGVWYESTWNMQIQHTPQMPYIYGTDPISTDDKIVKGTTISSNTIPDYNVYKTMNIDEVMKEYQKHFDIPVKEEEQPEEELEYNDFDVHITNDPSDIRILSDIHDSLHTKINKYSKRYTKTDRMQNLQRLFTTVVYSKEELFFLLKIALKAGINVDAIDPHTFPIAEVILGEKAVYIPYNTREKVLEMHVVPTGFTDNYLYDVLPLPEFMSTIGIESPREHILANFVSRKSKANSENTVDINGESYKRDIVEQLLDCNFDDFISNLQYESTMTFE